MTLIFDFGRLDVFRVGWSINCPKVDFLLKSFAPTWNTSEDVAVADADDDDGGTGVVVVADVDDGCCVDADVAVVVAAAVDDDDDDGMIGMIGVVGVVGVDEETFGETEMTPGVPPAAAADGCGDGDGV